MPLIPHLPLGTVYLVLWCSVIPVNIQNTFQYVPVLGVEWEKSCLEGACSLSGLITPLMVPEHVSCVIQMWSVWAMESDDGSLTSPIHREYMSMDEACLLLGFHVLEQKNLIAQQEILPFYKAQKKLMKEKPKSAALFFFFFSSFEGQSI